LKDLEAAFAKKNQTHSAMVVSSPDMETLLKILSEYAKKSEFDDYTLKSDRDDIMKRVAKLEKRADDHTDKFIKWEPDWGKMMTAIDELKIIKADKSDLDDAIARMKEIISQMNPGSNVVAFDSTDLKDAVKRL
jgi:hypothetical protein